LLRKVVKIVKLRDLEAKISENQRGPPGQEQPLTRGFPEIPEQQGA
jgi:hypothetical protein